jgi:molecular chaperone GrpE
VDNGKKTAEKKEKKEKKEIKIKEDPVKKQDLGKVDGGKKGTGKKEKNSKKHVKKSGKRGGKDLVDLLHHKNEILEKMRRELEQAKQLIEVKEDRLLRMIAEFDNFKKRINREQILLKKRMYVDVLGNLIPVLDDFDRAFQTQSGPGDDFKEGIKLICNRLDSIMKELGIKEIDAEGQIFKPEFHEALGEVEDEGIGVGKVAHVVLKGYMFDELVIRPAKVMVAGEKKKKEK